SLKSTEINDDDLWNIGKLKSLEQLDLECTKITDAGDAPLADLKNLRYLPLGGTKISDEALKTSGRLTKLEELLLTGTSIGDSGVGYLCDLPSVRSLVPGTAAHEQ